MARGGPDGPAARSEARRGLIRASEYGRFS